MFLGGHACKSHVSITVDTIVIVAYLFKAAVHPEVVTTGFVQPRINKNAFLQRDFNGGLMGRNVGRSLVRTIVEIMPNGSSNEGNIFQKMDANLIHEVEWFVPKITSCRYIFRRICFRNK